MKIPERTVAEVVQEASIKMSDPSYAQVLVGGWVQQQPAASKYVSAHVRELGGAEGVINTVFHAALIGTCFQRHGGRSIRTMTYAELDRVSDGDRETTLKKCQPALFDYLEANVENVEMKKVLVLLTLGMDYVS